MNSHSARKGRIYDEQTASGVEVTKTGDVSPDPEITEITVRVRLSEKSSTEHPHEFDVNQLRGNDAEAVRVESLVKGYVDPQGRGRRVSPRYAKTLTAVIYTSNQSFRSTTLNISVGGALLKDSLPREFQYGKLEILFIHEDPESKHKQYFMFKGEAMANSGPTARIQFLSATQAAQDALAQLLNQLDPKLIVA